MADPGPGTDKVPNTGNSASTLQSSSASSSASANAAVDAAKTASRNNAVFRALGMPNFRFRLPSRNWMIFFSIVGSWTATYWYDRREKKKVQQKWAALVRHIAEEPVHTNAMPRRMTIFLAAPPGDGVRPAREHFTEYVKPVLVAAAMDWDVVEGRREGEVRAGTAERVRRMRRKHGEQAQSELETDVPLALERLRDRIGVEEHRDVQGDLIIGRHTWKEYIRGIHEGWLGPLDPPPEKPAEETPSLLPGPTLKTVPDQGTASNTSPDSSSTSGEDIPSQPTESPLQTSDQSVDQKEEVEKKETPKPSKPKVKPPYNMPSSYSESPLPLSIPQELGPAAPIQFPHILGFLNTPIRCYRFLTRRHLADDIGRQTAAAVLAAHRPFRQYPESSSDDSEMLEQQLLLKREEKEWHKSARKRGEEDAERVWLDPIVIDPRIGERMMRFELTRENEYRAEEIGKGTAGIPGRIKPDSDV